MTRNSHIDRQREHQANERTFLAWLRTSVALIAFGFAITRFGLFLRQLRAVIQEQPAIGSSLVSSETLGVTLVAFGIITIALAAWRYNQVFWQIERGAYQPNRWLVWLTTGVVMILGMLSLPFLLMSDHASPSGPPPKPRPQNQNRVWGD